MQHILNSYFEVNVYVVLFMRIYIYKKKLKNKTIKQQIRKKNDVSDFNKGCLGTS